MKKLLHERLREYGNNCRADYADWLSQRHANELAYEIEKYYIPRPRFEDGKPVQFGDEFADGSGDPHTLHEIRYRDKAAAGLGAKCLLEANTASHKDYDGISFNLWDGTFVKRPEPKVLDADGVPCKKGETVYYAPGYITKDNKGPWKVLDIQGSDSVLIGRGYIPGEDDYMETVSGEAPDILTHREPDTLKKAVNDLGELLNYPMCDDIKLDKVEEVYNRLTAIMERDT